MDTTQDTKHSQKGVAIIVNGRERTVAKGDLSFEEVVALAFPGAPPDEQTAYTVTYKRGQGNKPEGTLVAGENVKVKEGMIINVTATRRS